MCSVTLYTFYPLAYIVCHVFDVLTKVYFSIVDDQPSAIMLSVCNNHLMIQ